MDNKDLEAYKKAKEHKMRHGYHDEPAPRNYRDPLPPEAEDKPYADAVEELPEHIIGKVKENRKRLAYFMRKYK